MTWDIEVDVDLARAEPCFGTPHPGALPPDLLDDALMALSDVDFFHTERGLGVMGVPLFDAYVEDFYTELMERLDAKARANPAALL